MANYICPVCGYDKLDTSPYEKNIQFPLDSNLTPPYSKYFGEPSYDVCSCCGFEFGNDDEPGTSDGVTFKSFLLEWIKDGQVWFEENKKPAQWSLTKQVKNIKIDPDDIGLR